MGTFLNLLLIFGLLSSTVSLDCPLGWLRYNQSCYLFHQVGLTWMEASHYCKSVGGHLAMVESVAEKDAIHQFLHQLPGDYWIDGVDDVIEGDWRWESTYSKINPLLWYPGEPNSEDGNEDCMETSLHYRGLWNDAGCGYRDFCICEQEMLN